MGFLVRLIGIEPTHPAPEAGALSTELQAHRTTVNDSINYYNRFFIFLQEESFRLWSVFLRDLWASYTTERCCGNGHRVWGKPSPQEKYY